MVIRRYVVVGEPVINCVSIRRTGKIDRSRTSAVTSGFFVR